MIRTIVKVPLDHCLVCERAIVEDDEGFFLPHFDYVKRGASYTRALQACGVCFDMADAIGEAQDDSRRFTRVGCLPHGSTSDTELQRCPCGAVGIARIKPGQWCVRCSRDVRMLTKQLAEVRYHRLLVKELRREVRNAQQG